MHRCMFGVVATIVCLYCKQFVGQKIKRQSLSDVSQYMITVDSPDKKPVGSAQSLEFLSKNKKFSV